MPLAGKLGSYARATFVCVGLCSRIHGLGTDLDSNPCDIFLHDWSHTASASVVHVLASQKKFDRHRRKCDGYAGRMRLLGMRYRFALGLVMSTFVVGCSGSDTTTVSGATGGAAGLGGASATGGALTSGGSSGIAQSGGAGMGGGNVTGGRASGGIAATGGAEPSGGAPPASGGSNATGGRVPTGGANTFGGVTGVGGGCSCASPPYCLSCPQNSGGSTSLGGTTGTGGATAAVSGGAVATGGKTTAGGAVATGGKTTAGGALATGGATTAGGTSATGGATGGGTSGNRSPGCGKAITRPNPNTQQTMDVQGTARTYLLDVPTSADNQTALPLIFALHGANMTNTSVVGSFNFDTRSGGKVVTVYPQGDDTSSGQRWTSNATNWTYIQNLMTYLEGQYCIDTTKVFLTGFSMGGGFTMDTACQHPDWFRAFATVEGYGPGGVTAATSPTCTNASTKAAMMIVQGTTDTTVTPAMGQASLAFWTGKNGCNSTTTTPTGAGFTSCTAYENCTSNLPVYYCTGTWVHTITTTAVGDVWAFFSSFK